MYASVYEGKIIIKKKIEFQLAPERWQDLHSGQGECRNLMETLAIDQAVLAQHVFSHMGIDDDVKKDIVRYIESICHEGITKRIAKTGVFLGQKLKSANLSDFFMDNLCSHPSDMVRSWAVYALVHTSKHLTLEDNLNRIKPLAADRNSGIREWAWMAVRPRLAEDVQQAVNLLLPWSLDQDANVRRFAVESIRPRGVWCRHIPILKDRPDIAETLLGGLCTDPVRYVQHSVANWVNDASKTRPEWARRVCARWLEDNHDCVATQKIIRRALRTLDKDSRNYKKG